MNSVTKVQIIQIHNVKHDDFEPKAFLKILLCLLVFVFAFNKQSFVSHCCGECKFPVVKKKSFDQSRFKINEPPGQH